MRGPAKTPKWKLRQRYGRLQALRVKNTDGIIRKITELALTIAHDDKEYEFELRIDILTSYIWPKLKTAVDGHS